MNLPPLVSFCIPTYNRSRYLDSLLNSLAVGLADFPYPFEVFVADNASSDETTQTLARFAELLPLRSVRHAVNLGGAANWQYLMQHAMGRYVVYVADDDGLLAPAVAQAIERLEANPAIGIAYAPWRLFDLVEQQDLGQFYRQDGDVLIPRGQHRQLLDTLLSHAIFPEIYICRRELLLAVMPRVSEQAFYAFVHAAEYLAQADVLFMREPFYVSITNYFADHQRVQAGTTEVESAWDRYRGGLEYVLGRASEQVDEAERLAFSLRIEQLIARRIAVAVRMRVANGRDPVDTYYLAYRLKAMGAQALLPISMARLRKAALLGFLLNDVELNRDIGELVCWGDVDADLRAEIEAQAKLPVRFVGAADRPTGLSAQSLLFALGEIDRAALAVDCPARWLHESTLLRKFSA